MIAIKNPNEKSNITLQKEEEEEKKHYLLEGFNFNDGLGVEGNEAVLDGLGHVLWGFRPRRLEE